MTFSQTPCPKEKQPDKAEPADSDVAAPKPAEDSDVETKGADGTRPMYANTNPEPTTSQGREEELAENTETPANQHRFDARDEEQRIQCRNNIESQIKSINTQMQAGYATSLLDSLGKKRRALEDRLNDC